MNAKELYNFFLEDKNYEWLKETMHKFFWKYGDLKYQLDLYYYPEAKRKADKFYAFSNVGGNSWLNDDHICLYSWNGENMDDNPKETGRWREWCREMANNAADDIITTLEMWAAEEEVEEAEEGRQGNEE